MDIHPFEPKVDVLSGHVDGPLKKVGVRESARRGRGTPNCIESRGQNRNMEMSSPDMSLQEQVDSLEGDHVGNCANCGSPLDQNSVFQSYGGELSDPDSDDDDSDTMETDDVNPEGDVDPNELDQDVETELGNPGYTESRYTKRTNLRTFGGGVL